MSDLMEKLAISKAIMDKHKTIERGKVIGDTPFNEDPQIQHPDLQNFKVPESRYNIPEEYLSSTPQPVQQTAPALTEDRIMKSRLPDEIKRLMMEHPITPVSPLVNGGPTLSEALVEKATKLMDIPSSGQQRILPKSTSPIPQNTDLRKLMKEVVEEVLTEHGLITESTTKSNDTLVLKVGQHIFEGKITRVKKLK